MENSRLTVTVKEIDKAGQLAEDRSASIYIDGEFVGSAFTREKPPMFVLKPGMHKIKAVSHKNNTREIEIKITTATSEQGLVIDCSKPGA